MVRLGSTGAEVRAVQHALELNIDGVFGEKTLKEVEKFQKKFGLKPDGIVGQKTWVELFPILKIKDNNPINPKIFFDNIRPLFGRFTQTQVDCLNILVPCLANQTTNNTSYLLATAFHETAATMKPIEEYGKGHGRKYGQRFKKDGQPYSKDLPIYYGRGYVQLTWYENYERAGDLLGIDLLHKPELALQTDVAYNIMEHGMMEGWFTGKRLNNYIALNGADYIGARKIINGTDRAVKIAKHADIFETALRRARA
jgi:putative chitinase